MRKLFIPFRIAKNRQLTITSREGDVEQLELSFIAGRNAKRSNHFGKQSGGQV